ncbi:MAG: phosphatidylglycerol lysyltransferase domain-containing protein [Candidatus Aminicenantes bacterium]|jgi:hypothetical protein|nr:phosphatidylglycerol lysyltransferase domain-containing protein [Candidatus Aminicenantes bacterium]
MNLPRFPDFKIIGLEDKEAILETIRRYPAEVCEVNFGNTFIWRKYDHPKLTTIHGNLCLLFEPPDEPAYFLQPIGENDIPDTIRTCLSCAPRLSRIPASFAARWCSGFQCAPDRNNFDYVYRTGDLIELKGKKYDGKRNRIRKFEREHAYGYVQLRPGHLEDCRRLFQEWLEDKSLTNKMLSAQNEAIQEGLAHFEALGLSGGAIEVEGKIEAFSIGEPLNPDTAVIHIEIVSPEYDGLSQLMNREFVKNEWAAFPFINREQDMGIPGLRRAKMSYYPHHMVEKHHIWKSPVGV